MKTLQLDDHEINIISDALYEAVTDQMEFCSDERVKVESWDLQALADLINIHQKIIKVSHILEV